MALANLPEEFKPLITALDAVGDENISYEKVKNMLLNYVDCTSDSKTAEDAFSAKRGWPGKGKQHNWNNDKKNKVKVFKGKCHNCQEKGHYARDCPKQKKNTENANQKRKNGSLYAAKEDDDLFTEDEALFTSDLVYNSGWMDN